MSNPDLKTDQGFSAIELMISQTLGMLVITAFIALLAPAILALGKNNTVSMQQESLRFATDLLHRTITQAGYHGCRSDIPSVSTIDAASPEISSQLNQWAYKNFEVNGISANDVEKITTLFGNGWNQNRFQFNQTAYGDILMLRAVSANEFTLAAHDPEAETINFEGNVMDALGQSHLLELNDCRQNTTVHLSTSLPASYDATSDTTRVHYSAAHTVNCTALDIREDGGIIDSGRVLLGNSGDAHCAGNSGLSQYDLYHYAPGTRAHLVKPVALYLGHDAVSGQPALYQMTIAADGIRSYSEALIEGVENIRILYGIDDNGDGIPDDYLYGQRMDQDSARWDQVVTIRLWLMMRTIAGRASTTHQQTIYFPDYRGQMVNCDLQHDRSILACPFNPDEEADSSRTSRRVTSFEIAIRNRGT